MVLLSESQGHGSGQSPAQVIQESQGRSPNAFSHLTSEGMLYHLHHVLFVRNESLSPVPAPEDENEA